MPGMATRTAAVTLATGTDEHAPIHQLIWVVLDEALRETGA